MVVVPLFAHVVPKAVIVSQSDQAADSRAGNAADVASGSVSASFGYGRRLHRPEEFSSVLSSRRVIRGQFFDLHYRFADLPDGLARLGLIVPKRLAKAASLRNAIKRQGREAFRLASSMLPSGDLVLRLSRPIKGIVARDEVQKKAWRAEIETLFRRLPVNVQQ